MAQKQYWWSAQGKFSPLDERKQRPDPVEVLHFYMELRGITSQARVFTLMEKLHLKRTAAQDVLKGKSLDSISRCRHLSALFEIPPQLLGLDACYVGKPLWWHQLGYSFEAGADGYPRIGQVLLFFRKKVLSWTQGDFAQALALSEVNINNMENERNSKALDHLGRRELIARVIQTATAATATSAPIFALLGLHEQAFVKSQEPRPSISPSASISIGSLDVHKRTQQALFEEYFTGHAQDVIGEAQAMLRILQNDVRPFVRGSSGQIEVLSIQSLYHQFIEDIAREQSRTAFVLQHANKAVVLAQDAVKLASSSEEEIQARELQAAALLRRAEAHFEQGMLPQATHDISQALSLCATTPTSHIKTHVLIDAGLIFAHAAQNRQDGIKALYFFDQAQRELGKITVATAQTKQDGVKTLPFFENDPLFIRSDMGMLQIRQGMALCSPKVPGNPVEALDKAEQFTPSELVRRQLLIEIFRAQALLNLKDYEHATYLALQALETSTQIRSTLNKNRVENLYQQLTNTSYAGEPLLVRLGVQLQMWS